MFRNMILFALVLCCGLPAWANENYPAARQTIMQQVQAGEHAQALTAFVELAATTDNEAQQSDAFQQAAMCAHRLKDAEQAMALAGQIPNEAISKTVQMRLMLDRRQYAEVAERFGSEQMADWPVWIAGEARYYRGQAHASIQQGKAAEADLRQAVDTLPDGPIRGAAAMALARNYQQNLSDPEQALQAYRLAQQFERKRDPHAAAYYNALIAAAAILRDQGEHEQATTMLEQVDVTEMRGYWGVALRLARAEVLASQGESRQAIAMFNDALAIEGIAAHHQAAAQQRIAELQD